MARIDRFIQGTIQARAERLVLASGEKARLAGGGADRPISAQPATDAQVRELVAEILPANLAGALDAPGRHEFPYLSPAGVVLVSLDVGAETLRVELIPAAETAPVASAARPAATSAPAAPVTDRPRSAPQGEAAAGMDALLRTLVSEKCSDLHLSSGNPPLFRKDGEMVAIGGPAPVGPDAMRDLLFSITPGLYQERFEAENDVDFSYEIAGLARFRCNLFVDRHGPGGVFRIIPARVPTAKELGVPPAVLDLCRMQKGLVLVTGPTGSGKSTTLASLIDHINGSRAAHIITIEDPIEFVHPRKKCLINQREVGTHTRGFKHALRAALREDPDIVLVGEMRDLETVAIAIETAETGHLVFGTLHTNTAPSTVDRIIDQFPSDRQSQVRTMLSESLKGVVSQTLCRKKGGGRVAALEILLVTSAICNLIREAKTFQIPSLMQTGRGAGMVCMNDSLLELVTKGIVDPAEALAKTVNKAELKSMLQRQNIPVEA